MSTAYPPRFIKYILSSKKERNAARSATMQPGEYGELPSTIGLFYQGTGQDFLSMNFVLTSLDPRAEIYAVTFHKGPGSTQATIYSTTDHGSTPLSVATNEKRYGSSINVTIAGETVGQPTTIRVGYSGFNSNKHSFSMHGQSFQLRERAVKRPKMIEVVWQGTAGSSDESSESQNSSVEPKQPTQGSAVVTDEVIATWTEGALPNREGRLAIFRFGESRPIERFGKDWALVTVSACLAICQQGAAIEGTRSWHEEKMLEKSNYR